MVYQLAFIAKHPSKISRFCVYDPNTAISSIFPECSFYEAIYDYSSLGKIVDKNLIDKIVEIVVKEKNLNDYVKNVKYTNELYKNNEKLYCASYNDVTREITIDYESLHIFLSWYDPYRDLFNDFENIMFTNFTIIQIVLHELEHAYQNKVAESKNDKTLETALIKISYAFSRVCRSLNDPEMIRQIVENDANLQKFLFYILKNRELYHQLYIFNPMERLADINSAMIVKDSLKMIEPEVPNLYTVVSYTLIQKMLSGYGEVADQGCCPTEIYLKGINQNEIWQGFSFYSPDTLELYQNVIKEHTLKRRLTLGLPVYNNERTNMFDLLKEMDI